MYDVIVVGARVAGASTALLLARKGLKVLALDRATFPSDSLSSHQVQLPGAAALKRWGLLDAVIAAPTPPTREVRLDTGGVSLAGRFPSFEGVDALYSPRRRVLDTILVDAAREAGAEVREDFVAEELTIEGGLVTGVRGRVRGGATVAETARLVVGADGRHSLVARTVDAAKYREQPTLAIGYYAYWRGLSIEGGEMYLRERRSVGVWPTNDGLVVTFLSAPRGDFEDFRSDIEGSFLRTFDQAGSLGERIRGAERVEPFRGSADVPNWFRKPFGPGWALVGDAGLVMDPITGQGITQALLDAELLSDAVYAALDGSGNLEATLSEYQGKRDLRALPIYELTLELASFRPPTVEQEVLFSALRGRPEEIERFLGLLAGVESRASYSSLRHAVKLLGLTGVARILSSKCVSLLRRPDHRPRVA